MSKETPTPSNPPQPVPPPTPMPPPVTAVQQPVTPPPDVKPPQQWIPFLLGALSVVFIVVGIVLVLAFTGEGQKIPFLNTDTPTPTSTNTPTPSPTNTPTATPTSTPTPSPTLTPTPSEPFEYTVEEGDSLIAIAEKFDVDLITLMLLNNMNNNSTLYVGQKIIIPAPNTKRPTPTPLPTVMPKGYEIRYFVMPNDTLQGIAAKFNTTVDAIVEANETLEDAFTPIYAGQILIVPVNLITPTPTPTS